MYPATNIVTVYKRNENPNYIRSEIPDNVIQLPIPQKSNNKKPGKKSEVYEFKFSDLKRLMSYFVDNNLWIHYLLSVFSLNFARRINDTLSLKWEDIFDKDTGEFKILIEEIKEKKTNKLASPFINSAVQDAVKLYCEKTGCDPSDNDYSNPVFLQVTGNYAGTVLTDSGSLKAIKKAAKAVGIKYNVGNHSFRKTFGMINKVIHPGDPYAMIILKDIFNHSDVSVTERYIGLTRERIKNYYSDVGDFCNNYVTGDKEYVGDLNKPVTSFYSSDIRDILLYAFKAGRETDINEGSFMLEVMQMIEEFSV